MTGLAVLRPTVSHHEWQVYRTKKGFSRRTSAFGFTAIYQLEEWVPGARPERSVVAAILWPFGNC
jgi:hypothetical protein